jgi:hypothetical protein
MIYFCTLFDSHFLARGLALYRSIIANVPESKVCILALDFDCFSFLASLNEPKLSVFNLDLLEKGNDVLTKAKSNRSKVEFCYTCKPFLCDYIFKNYPDAEIVIYVDADMFFFKGLDDVLPNINMHSVTLSPHRFSKEHLQKEIIGTYNAGWVSFHKDLNGLNCLDWWKKKCADWCYEQLFDGRWADQGYLSLIPGTFRNVSEIDHPGANLALWNIGNFTLSINERNEVLVNGQPLLFYHFHGLRKVVGPIYDMGIAGKAAHLIWNYIYSPYIKSVSAENATLPKSLSSKIFTSNRKRKKRSDTKLSVPEWIVSMYRTLRYMPQGFYKGSYHIFKS